MLINGEAPEIDLDAAEMLIEREPVTIICSEKGWIRTAKVISIWIVSSAGKVMALPSCHAETTDKILLFAENGCFYTLAADKLPKGHWLVNL